MSLSLNVSLTRTTTMVTLVEVTLTLAKTICPAVLTVMAHLGRRLLELIPLLLMVLLLLFLIILFLLGHDRSRRWVALRLEDQG